QSAKLPKEIIPQGYPQISILYPQLGPQFLLGCRASGQKNRKILPNRRSIYILQALKSSNHLPLLNRVSQKS
ncbi:MAG: hypothetical protein ACPG6U_06905, partial [Paracoccaceae bacterium]